MCAEANSAPDVFIDSNGSLGSEEGDMAHGTAVKYVYSASWSAIAWLVLSAFRKTPPAIPVIDLDSLPERQLRDLGLERPRNPWGHRYHGLP